MRYFRWNSFRTVECLLNERQEVAEMAALLKKIDGMGPEYVNTVSAEMFQYQPFFLTVLLGYRLDASLKVLEEIMKIYFLIWEYFRKNPKIRVKQVTEKDFEAAQRRFIQMLQYAEGKSASSREQCIRIIGTMCGAEFMRELSLPKWPRKKRG